MAGVDTIWLLLLLCLPAQLWIVRGGKLLSSLLGVMLFSLILAMGVAPLGLAEQAPLLQLAVIGMCVVTYLGLAGSGRRQDRLPALADQASQSAIASPAESASATQPLPDGIDTGTAQVTAAPRAPAAVRHGRDG